MKGLFKEFDVGLLTSEGFIGDVARHFASTRLSKIAEEKPVIIMYISDYDCEGEHIYHLAEEDLELHDIRVEKVAINKEQVIELNLISNIGYRDRILGNPRTLKYHLNKQYVREFFEYNRDLGPDGIVQFELDACPVPDLMELTKDAIGRYIDLSIIELSADDSKKEVKDWIERHIR